MGASLVIRTHADADKATISEFVRATQASNAFERGHSYSGEWNTCHGGVHFPVTPVFENQMAAETYIEENHQKGEPIMAVKAKETRSLEVPELLQDTAYKELNDKVKALAQERWGLEAEVLKRSKAAKSQFRACPKCKSKLNVAFMPRLTCPLCNDNVLWTPTDEKRKLAVQKSLGKVTATRTKRAEALFKKKFPTTPLTQEIWVVGGWCSC